jgi:DNA-binding GntR family transcriptional regulator
LEKEDDVAKTVVRAPLAQQVYLALKDAIVRGELKQGERLVELDLARRYGLSQAPVREALARLAKEGLVVSYPHKGTFVSNFTDQDIDEIYSFREIIEPFAIRRAVERLTDADLEQLRRCYQAMLDADRTHDLEALGRADIAFHTTIYEAAQHRFMLEVWRLLSTKAHRIWWHLHYEVFFPSLLEAARLHAPILEAFAARDAERAVAAFGAHLEFAKRQIEAARNPDNP